MTCADSSIFRTWRRSLSHSLAYFAGVRAKTRYFHAKAFAVFAAINLICYWWALLTSYPGLLASAKWLEYVLTGFPVSALGAVFDLVSLVITVAMIRRALATPSKFGYLFYLSVDLVIAAIAGLWVLLAFYVSGWLVSLILVQPETLEARTILYQGRLASLWQQPLNPDNVRNFYFGMVMGASALLPTLFHVSLALRSVWRCFARANAPLPTP